MNSLSRSKSSEKLRKGSRKRVTRKHHGVHGSQGSSATINGFPNVLSTVLKKHNSMTALGIRPKTLDPL
jgi:hypothetical protein